jgi:hypothetical protein
MPSVTLLHGTVVYFYGVPATNGYMIPSVMSMDNCFSPIPVSGLPHHAWRNGGIKGIAPELYLEGINLPVETASRYGP